MEPLNYEWLMRHARSPSDVLTQAFASAIQSASANDEIALHASLGLGEADFAALMERLFPGVLSAGDGMGGCAPLRTDEYEDVLALLMEHRTYPCEESEWLARAIAAACMGDNHLWQDLGLQDRRQLSRLLAEQFAELSARNTGNMKWKKFFYRQLCERAGIRACRAPSCNACDDYPGCFDPEEKGSDGGAR